ncbi:hypothetical protein SETIT_7G257000v2 [Setaria italica]|uniref:Uncharacterized protein n=1 Tax=Setaria italica TaxID=4555 RepID=A0A368RZL4_SETIT|nr:hypothetical protein SETIT_7G257000v2 [Setaria italica]
MASFAAQLKDMFFFLVERVTGYGGRQEEPKLHTIRPTKLASAAAEVAQTEVVVVKRTEIRA